MKKIGIWGWWQGHNLGDNWIKNILGSFFPNAVFVPTSIQNFSEYDYIICGGGGLFIYDVISPFDKVAELQVPFGIIGIGAEFEHQTRNAVELEKKADFFYARDQYSVDCMRLPQECRSYDVTFLDPMPFSSIENVNLDKLYFVWRDGRRLSENDKFSKYICYEDTKIEWERVIKNHFTEVLCNDFQTNDWNIYEQIESCGFVISGRYHGIIAAIQRGIPFIAIDICPKIRALTQECGLEEFCIKVSETDKIDSLIDKAKKEINYIRNQERQYVKKANETVLKQMLIIRRHIIKRLYLIKVIHYGSYWMGENDVISVMADDLASMSDSKIIDLKEYSQCVDERIKSVEKTPNGSVCRLDTMKVINDVEKYNPDAVILNSGGLCMEPDLISYLHKKGIISVGISLSDPDVYPYNGQKYGKDFSLFYTNSKYSLINQYDKEKINIHLLPFAASINHHYYMPEVEKKYDLVVVGFARKERVDIINQLSGICNIGTYGAGWKNSLGVVKGIEQVKAINSGNMYLSFSHTCAGFENVKVGLFEAMACNQFVITFYMEELNDYFEIGKEIVCYRSVEELQEIVKYYLTNEAERENIRLAGYRRLLRDHTYQNRWEKVFLDVYREKE